MLPDYSNLKNKLKEVLLLRMEKIQSIHSHIISDVNRGRIFEGNKSIIIREDGSFDETNFKEIYTEFNIKVEDIENLSPEEIIQKIDDAARDLADQKTKFMFDELGKALKKVGNEINVGGRKFSIQDFFDILRKIWIDFDDAGNPYLPTIYAGEKLAKSMVEEFRKYENDPKYRSQFEEIIEIKRQEWNAREDNRKLVG